MKMVDVGGKEKTERVAIATARLKMQPATIRRIRRKEVEKGDVLAAAKLAAVMAAKKTPDLIPLCHPIALHGVDLALDLGETSVGITATVRTADRTGVEMEALTAVATAGLAVIDMIKAVDPAATISDVRVLRKEGGKTGLWEREAEFSEREASLSKREASLSDREASR